MRTGLRPEAGERLENWAKSAGGSSDAHRVAAAYWKAFEYRYVAPELGAITFQRHRPVTETGQCTPTDDDTTRWLVPGQTRGVLRGRLARRALCFIERRPTFRNSNPGRLRYHRRRSDFRPFRRGASVARRPCEWHASLYHLNA